MRRLLIVLGLTVVLVLGLVVWRADRLGISDLYDDLTSPDPSPRPSTPAEIPPPPGLDLPRLPEAPAVLQAVDGGRVSTSAVRRALGGLPDAKRLGPRVAVAVAGVDGRPVYETGPDVVTPASLLKTVTALATLDVVGPQHTFTTRTVRSGGQGGAGGPGGTVTLVGGGDPLLASTPADGLVPRRADLTTLARETAAALRRGTDSGNGDGTSSGNGDGDGDGKGNGKGPGPITVAVRYDDSLFSGPSLSPLWRAIYVPEEVVPITALWSDEGRIAPGVDAWEDDPSRAAAADFADALRATGVKVSGVRPGRAPQDAEDLASVRSAPLVEIVQHVLEASDNNGAEVLLRQAAIAVGAPATFDGGTRTVRATLDDLGVRLPGGRLVDGSGLSRQDRVPVTGLLDVLATSLDPDRPQLAGVADGLLVAGFTGSLVGRFLVGADDGLGYVRAKTGTLSGVHGMAGVVTGRDGTPMLFVAVVDRVKEPNTLFARAQLDKIAAALAGCRCGA